MEIPWLHTTHERSPTAELSAPLATIGYTILRQTQKHHAPNISDRSVKLKQLNTALMGGYTDSGKLAGRSVAPS